MKYIFLTTFFIFTIIHLYASLRQLAFLRGVTKGFILYSLLSYYIYATPNPSWFVVLAIIFSWLGDMLLIPKGNKWFAIGGISFMISHALFVVSYCNYINFSNVQPWVYIVFGLLYAAIVFFIFKGLKPYILKFLFYPMIVYLLINGTMNCFAIFRLFSEVNLGSIITVIGAVLFFISDSSLFYVRFNKNSVLKTHFVVMATYSFAEFLIILGFMI